jgi:hypothetical protein
MKRQFAGGLTDRGRVQTTGVGLGGIMLVILTAENRFVPFMLLGWRGNTHQANLSLAHDEC